jgi:hypothetical protein
VQPEIKFGKIRTRAYLKFLTAEINGKSASGPKAFDASHIKGVFQPRRRELIAAAMCLRSV